VLIATQQYYGSMEDEDGTRDLASQFLNSAGYAVLEASDDEQALAKIVRAGTRIDLLLTDVAMRRMRGPELPKQMANRWVPKSIICPDTLNITAAMVSFAKTVSFFKNRSRERRWCAKSMKHWVSQSSSTLTEHETACQGVSTNVPLTRTFEPFPGSARGCRVENSNA
jgi:DNA-binding NtrC family response regulator